MTEVAMHGSSPLPVFDDAMMEDDHPRELDVDMTEAVVDDACDMGDEQMETADDPVAGESTAWSVEDTPMDDDPVMDEVAMGRDDGHMEDATFVDEMAAIVPEAAPELVPSPALPLFTPSTPSVATHGPSIALDPASVPLPASFSQPTMAPAAESHAPPVLDVDPVPAFEPVETAHLEPAEAEVEQHDPAIDHGERSALASEQSVGDGVPGAHTDKHGDEQHEVEEIEEVVVIEVAGDDLGDDGPQLGKASLAEVRFEGVPGDTDKIEFATTDRPAMTLSYRHDAFTLFRPYIVAAESKPNQDWVPYNTEARPTILEGEDEAFYYYGPLSRFFRRLHAEFPTADEDQQELRICFKVLSLEISEDSIYAREVSLYDIDRLYAGSRLHSSLHLTIEESLRFPHRFNTLAEHVANIARSESDEATVVEAGDAETEFDEGAEAHSDLGDETVIEAGALDDRAGEFDDADEEGEAAYQAALEQHDAEVEAAAGADADDVEEADHEHGEGEGAAPEPEEGLGDLATGEVDLLDETGEADEAEGTLDTEVHANEDYDIAAEEAEATHAPAADEENPLSGEQLDEADPASAPPVEEAAAEPSTADDAVDGQPAPLTNGTHESTATPDTKPASPKRPRDTLAEGAAEEEQQPKRPRSS